MVGHGHHPTCSLTCTTMVWFYPTVIRMPPPIIIVFFPFNYYYYYALFVILAMHALVYGRERVKGNMTNKDGNDKAVVAEKPIVCLVRHLSPMGRLMNRTAFDFMARNSPTFISLGEGLDSNLKDDTRNLIKVEIAGVYAPPHFTAKVGEESEGEWLRSLAANQTSIVCTLLSRRIVTTTDRQSKSTFSLSTLSPLLPDKNESPLDTADFKNDNDNDDMESRQVAICNVSYRPPGLLTLLRSDLASTLVQAGRAGIVSSSTGGVHVDVPSTKTIDGSRKMKDLRRDVQSLGRLEGLEFEAVKGGLGMWSDKEVRRGRPELVEEADFERTASAFEKIWRWVRRG